MEPAPATAESHPGRASHGHRQSAAGRRRGRLSRRRRSGMARALERQSQSARAGIVRMKDLIAQLSKGSVKVVDLTHTLSPDFPAISLPPEMGQAWPFRIEEVSRYDERGPAWYWNNFSCGEHTGTHFDA